MYSCNIVGGSLMHHQRVLGIKLFEKGDKLFLLSLWVASQEYRISMYTKMHATQTGGWFYTVGRVPGAVGSLQYSWVLNLQYKYNIPDSDSIWLSSNLLNVNLISLSLSGRSTGHVWFFTPQIWYVQYDVWGLRWQGCYKSTCLRQLNGEIDNGRERMNL